MTARKYWFFSLVMLFSKKDILLSSILRPNPHVAVHMAAVLISIKGQAFL